MPRRASAALAVVAFVVALFACGKKAAPPENVGCTTDADCTLTCHVRQGCCPSPCGCTIAVAKAEVQAIEDYNREYCTPELKKKCPVVGACGPVTRTFEAKCTSGRCTTESKPIAGDGGG